MVNKLKSRIINIDKSILKIMKQIIKISLLLCAISSLILCMYISNPISNNTYFAGLQIFKSALYFIVAGIACGISIDYIMNLYKI